MMKGWTSMRHDHCVEADFRSMTGGRSATAGIVSWSVDLGEARQSLIAPSWLPVARIVPSGENAIPWTAASCPLRVKHFLTGDWIPEPDRLVATRGGQCAGHRD